MVGSLAPIIDSISLKAAVPEPGTWALMGLGLLGLASAAQRQRRSGR